MKYSDNMLKSLNLILESCKSQIDNKQVSKVESTFHKFVSCFNKFFNTLTSEKIVNMDPYAQEYDFTKLNLPDQFPIQFNDEEYAISVRLSKYSSLLHYILDKKIICTDKLTPVKVEKLTKIVNFLEWNRVFDPQPLEVNTEATNRVLFNFQKEHDRKFVLASIKNILQDIEIYKDEFITELEPIKLYLNERYKLTIREYITKNINFPEILKGENIKKAHDKISKKTKELKLPVYIELIGEILKEDYSNDGEAIRDNIIKQLTDMNNKRQKSKVESIKKASPIKILESSILELSKCESQLEPTIEKILDNSIMFRSENYSVIQKLLDHIKYNLLSHKRETVITLKVSSANSKKLMEKDLEFEKFILSIKSFNKQIKGLKNSKNPEFVDLFSKEEDEINRVIHKLISKCRYIHKLLSALDQYFKENLRSSKGIQIELNVILSALDKGQELYFKYTKLKSELQVTTYKPDKTQVT